MTHASFGWQGIEIAVPGEWELASYSGNGLKGEARLDDGLRVRLHAEWLHEKGAPIALEAVVEKYRAGLVKKYGEEAGFGCEAVGTSTALPEARLFHWNAEDAVHGLLWCCRACARMGLVEIYLSPSKSDGALARHILASVRDHREDGWRLWSAYGFAFLAPASYNLEKTEFAPGRLRYVLAESKRCWICVERWAMASLWFTKPSIEQWPEEWLKLMRFSFRGPVALTATEVDGHGACRFVAMVSRGFSTRQSLIEGVVWRRLDEDKVFAVMGSTTQEGLQRRVADSVECAASVVKQEK